MHVTDINAGDLLDAQAGMTIHPECLEQLHGDLWRAVEQKGYEFKLEVKRSGDESFAFAKLQEPDDGDEWVFGHRFPIIAIAGVMEMASGRRETLDYEPMGVGQYQDCPRSMVEHELRLIDESGE